MYNRHFFMVLILTAMASVAIRLWTENAPISARSAGLT